MNFRKKFNFGFSTTEKPTCPVKVDWDELSRLNFTPDFVMFDRTNLITGEQADISNSAISVKPIGGHGVGIYNDGTNASGSDYAYFLNGGSLASKTELTIVFSVYPEAIDGNDVFFQQSVSNSDFLDGLTVWVDNTGTYTSNTNCLSVSIDRARIETSSNSLAANELHNVCITWKGGTTVEVWIDGALRANSFSSGTPGTMAGTVQDIVRIGGMAALDGFKGGVFFAAKSSKSVSSGAAKSLSLNPYQILKPAIDTFTILGSAAAGSGITGTLEGALPSLTANFDGTFYGDFDGTLEGTLPSLTGDFNGTFYGDFDGTLEGTLPSLTGDFNGTVGAAGDFDGTLEGTLPSLTASFDGTFYGNFDATMDGTLPSLTGDFNGTVSDPIEGTLEGALPSLTGDFNGTVANATEGTLEGVLPSLTGSFSGSIPVVEDGFATGGWDYPQPPTKEEVRKQREQLGIIKPTVKPLKSIEKVKTDFTDVKRVDELEQQKNYLNSLAELHANIQRKGKLKAQREAFDRDVQIRIHLALELIEERKQQLEEQDMVFIITMLAA